MNNDHRNGHERAPHELFMQGGGEAATHSSLSSFLC